MITDMFLNKLILALFLCLLSTMASARPIISDLSERQIKIHAKFTGKDLLLYGARVEAGDLVVVLRGPKNSYIVRRKEQVAGAWINTESVEFDEVPQFYRVLSSRKFAEIDADSTKKNLGLGLNQLTIKTKSDSADSIPFMEALRKKLKKDDLLDNEIKQLPIIEGTLFRTRIHFPKRIAEGVYTAEIYSFDDGELKGMQSIPIEVKKVGFEAFVFSAAHNNPAFYGTFAILIAASMGWFASGLLRKV